MLHSASSTRLNADVQGVRAMKRAIIWSIAGGVVLAAAADLVHPSDTSFCRTCSSVTGLLPSMNTGPLSRSRAAVNKAAAAASTAPPAIDHMIARFMALTPCTSALSLVEEAE